MDRITLTQKNRLFWLGRYAERVYQATAYMMKIYDQLIDNIDFDYESYCKNLGIPCNYTDAKDFCLKYLFDGSDPFSIRSAADAMLGNGMELRSTLTSTTLAYLQMASTALDEAAASDSPCVALQWVLDDIMAFRGSFDDSIHDEGTRNTIKAGRQVERLSLFLRADINTELIPQELKMLLFRVDRADLDVDRASYGVIKGEEAGEKHDRHLLLGSVEGLIKV